MPPATTSTKQDKRELILAAALELFAEHGFAGSAVPLVAEAAGVATGTIYRYFPSKEALVNALYQQWKGDIKRRLIDEREPAGSAREEFHHWWNSSRAVSAGSRSSIKRRLMSPFHCWYSALTRASLLGK